MDQGMDKNYHILQKINNLYDNFEHTSKDNNKLFIIQLKVSNGADKNLFIENFLEQKNLSPKQFLHYKNFSPDKTLLGIFKSLFKELLKNYQIRNLKELINLLLPYFGDDKETFLQLLASKKTLIKSLKNYRKLSYLGYTLISVFGSYYMSLYNTPFVLFIDFCGKKNFLEQNIIKNLFYVHYLTRNEQSIFPIIITDKNFNLSTGMTLNNTIRKFDIQLSSSPPEIIKNNGQIAFIDMMTFRNLGKNIPLTNFIVNIALIFKKSYNFQHINIKKFLEKVIPLEILQIIKLTAIINHPLPSKKILDIFLEKDKDHHKIKNLCRAIYQRYLHDKYYYHFKDEIVRKIFKNLNVRYTDDLITKLIKRFSSQPTSSILLAKLYYLKKNTLKSREILKQMLAKSKTPKTTLSSIEIIDKILKTYNQCSNQYLKYALLKAETYNYQYHHKEALNIINKTLQILSIYISPEYKLKFLLEKCRSYTNLYTNPDYLNSIEEAIAIAIDIQNFPNLAEAYFIKACTYSRNKNIRKAFEFLSKSENIAKKYQLKSIKLKIIIERAYIYSMNNKLNESQELLKEIYPEIEKSYYKDILPRVLQIYIHLNFYIKNTEKVEFYSKKLFQISKNNFDIDNMVVALGNMAIIHKEKCNYQESIYLYKKQITMNTIRSKTINNPQIYNNIAILYQAIHKYETALSLIKKAKKMDNNSSLSFGLIDSNVAILEFYAQDLPINKKVVLLNHSIERIFNYYFKTNDFFLSLILYKKAFCLLYLKFFIEAKWVLQRILSTINEMDNLENYEETSILIEAIDISYSNKESYYQKFDKKIDHIINNKSIKNENELYIILAFIYFILSTTKIKKRHIKYKNIFLQYTKKKSVIANIHIHHIQKLYF